MLMITIELFPHGRVREKQELARMVIANDMTGTRERGNYIVELFDGGGKVFSGIVKDHDRSSHVADLVAKAIKAVDPRS